MYTGEMMNNATTIGFLVVAAALMAGCNDKTENTTITRYATDKCNVESIAGKPDAIVYVKPGKVEINGWAFDDAKHAVADDLELHISGAQGQPVVTKKPVKISRPDVAKAYNNKDLNSAGFSFTVDTSSLTKGAYGVTINIPKGNALYVCQTKKTVVIM
jgi:hypothetical protein